MSEDTFADWVTKNIVGSYTDADEVTQRLCLAQQHCHVIGGRTACPPLADGVAVLLQAVWVSPQETYKPTKGGDDDDRSQRMGADDELRGISGTALFRIAAAAGVRWTKVERIDDGRNRRFASFEVEGQYVGMDLMPVKFTGSREIDLSDGSDEVASDSPKKLANLRKTLVRSAETKAQLRAIRKTFGIRPMTVAELRMPFIVPQLAFTGKSSNPMIARMMAMAVMEAFGVSKQVLYGGPAPKQISAEGEVVDDWEDEPPPEPRPKRFAPPPPPMKVEPQRETQPERPPPVPGEWVARFGKCSGMSVSQIPTEDLEWYVTTMRSSLDDPKKAEFKAKNERTIADIVSEIEKRKAAPT